MNFNIYVIKIIYHEFNSCKYDYKPPLPLSLICKLSFVLFSKAVMDFPKYFFPGLLLIKYIFVIQFTKVRDEVSGQKPELYSQWHCLY